MRYWIEQVLRASVLVLFMGGIVLANAHAGVLDQIVGIDPPLKKRINVMKWELWRTIYFMLRNIAYTNLNYALFTSTR